MLARSEPALRFAVVHPYSGHNYELRYWLAACGIDPARDVEIVIVPPPLMADALAGGTIDGYCVGEPWNTAAACCGRGRIVTVKAAIWRSSPEKVLSAGAKWAARQPGRARGAAARPVPLGPMVREPGNREELARYPRRARPISRARRNGCCTDFRDELDAGGGDVRRVDDFFVPFAKAATFPWKSHALWFYSQMVRWGQVPHTAENASIARETYRPDLYRAALKPLGIALPVANAKVEGALQIADAGRLGGRQPHARAGRIFRWRPVRSRPARRLHRRPKALAHRAFALHKFCADRSRRMTNLWSCRRARCVAVQSGYSH